jgi:hypothetical protein
MADTVIYVRDAKNGNLLPIKIVDSGGGVYTAGSVVTLVIKEDLEVKNG